MNLNFKAYTYFFVYYIAFVLFYSIGLVILGKIDFQIWLNGANSSFFNYFFFYITHLVAAIPLIIIFLLVGYFSSVKEMIIITVCYAATSVTAQLLKRVIVGTLPRPIVLIDHLILLPKSFNMEQHELYSFPSGHTTTAFALATFFTYFFNNKKIGLLLVFVASLIGYSRIYLSQHFVIDVLAGSAIGIIGALSIIQLLSNINFGKLAHHNLFAKKL